MAGTEIVGIDYARFRLRCKQDEKQFHKLGKVVDTPKGKYIYIDNGSPVLGIAHLDSVQIKHHFHVIEVDGETWVMCPQLDDRIGVYALLDLLPALGVKTDILLTTNEETGNSTAMGFTTEKEYNWMYQFDRRGEDVVHYMFGTKFLKKRLKRAGFDKIEYGAGSDICKLQDLGCCGFNVGTGYKDEHSMWAMANMEVFARQVNRFVDFYEKFKELKFEYTKKETPASTWKGYTYNNGWQEGYVWDFVKGKYVPPGTESVATKPVTSSKPPVTSIVNAPVVDEKCAGCNVRLWTHNTRMTPFDDVCDNCMEEFFECIGCGKSTRYNQSDGVMCQECRARLETEGRTNFMTIIKCANQGCLNSVTYGEYVGNGKCSDCTDAEYFGGMYA